MINTIKLIFLDIAKSHDPHQMQWLKCFVHLDQASDFNEANFGKNRQDYEAGDYWTRKPLSWNEDCKQYPALTFEWMPTNINIVSGSFNFTLMLNVVSQYECMEANNLTRHQVDENIMKVLLSVIDKSKQYKLWLVTINGQLYNIWATKEQIAAWKEAGKINEAKKLCESLLSTYNIENVPLQKSWFGVDKLRSVQAQLSFYDCSPEHDTFEYIQIDSDFPTTICRKC